MAEMGKEPDSESKIWKVLTGFGTYALPWGSGCPPPPNTILSTFPNRPDPLRFFKGWGDIISFLHVHGLNASNIVNISII